MQITVNLNDVDINAVVTKGIQNLSDEDVKNIAKEALVAYLSKELVMEKLIFQEHQYYGRDKTPRDWVTEMLEKGFTPEEVDEYRKKLLDILKNRDDRRDLLAETLAKALGNIVFNGDMRAEFYHALTDIQQLKEKVNDHS